MRSGNPALRVNTFRGMPWTGADTMTVEGSVNKTLFLFVVLFAAGAITWNSALSGSSAQVEGLTALGGIGGMITAFVIIFNRQWSPYLAPVYAALEGLLLGGFSAYLNVQYPGIALEAVGLTLATMAVMLVAYKTGAIRVTPALQRGIVAATGGVFVFYLVSWIASFFLHYSLMMVGGPIGIGISLVIVAIAAFNLVLDFNVIEESAGRAPRYMEWYAGFGLMVTLVWLYVELLRLLVRFQQMSRD